MLYYAAVHFCIAICVLWASMWIIAVHIKCDGEDTKDDEKLAPALGQKCPNETKQNTTHKSPSVMLGLVRMPLRINQVVLTFWGSYKCWNLNQKLLAPIAAAKTEKKESKHQHRRLTVEAPMKSKTFHGNSSHPGRAWTTLTGLWPFPNSSCFVPKHGKRRVDALLIRILHARIFLLFLQNGNTECSLHLGMNMYANVRQMAESLVLSLIG